MISMPPTVRNPQVLSCLARAPSGRLQNIQEFEDAIRQWHRQSRSGSNKSRITLDSLAKRFDCSRGAVIAQARNLGLCRTRAVRQTDWSEKELEILNESAHLTSRTIQMRLKRSGFSRTLGAIIKIRRDYCGSQKALREDREIYTPKEIAGLLGISDKTIGRWIRLGELKAEIGDRQISDGNGQRISHDYLIKEFDIRDFIKRHPMRFDFGKSDPIWLVGMLTRDHRPKS